MQDQPEHAEPRETEPESRAAVAGLDILLAPALAPLFEPPPSDIADRAWSANLPFLAWLVANARPTLLVTVGARTAYAHLACCDTVARFALPTRCRAVLEPRADGAPAFPADLLRRHQAHHAGVSHLAAALPAQETARFADGSIDLLIISVAGDPDWSGATGAGRLDRWRLKLSPAAVMVVHGIGGDEPEPALWRTLRASHPVFALAGTGAGLGVAAVGPRIVPDLGWLFRQRDESAEAARLRDRLAALGERWRLGTLLHDEQAARASQDRVADAELLAAKDALRTLSVAHGRLRDELAFAKADRYRSQRLADAMTLQLRDQEHRHQQERARGESLARDRADARAADLDLKLDSLRAALGHAADRTVADRGAERDAARQALAAANAGGESLRIALADAQAAVQALQGSLSWRLTQPLRTLRARFRGGATEPTPVALAASATGPALLPSLPEPAEPLPPVADPDAWPAHRRDPEPDPEPGPSAPAAIVSPPPPPLLGPGGWRRIRRILFVAGEPDTPGAAYRTARNAAACRAAGFDAECVDIAGVDPVNLAAADLVVLWRAGFSAHVQTMLALAAQARTRVVFDVDDLIIQPALAVAEIIDGIRTTFVTEAESRAYFQSMQRTMLNCDLCTTTTRELAAAMGRQHPMVRILPNTFDDAVERASRRAVRLRGERAGDGLVRLGYAGGTRTHQKDFATVVPSLASVLEQRAQVRLVLFRDGRSGEGLVLLDEFPALLPFADRIEWRDLVPLAELPSELARFDISLCPLEGGNPFCESKSELKYFESALAGVCVVATPTGPFRRAVRDGVTGFLPDDERNWTGTLLRLVDDPALRRRVARAAFHDVSWRFGPRRQAELWALLLGELDGGADGARAADLALRRGDPPPAELPEVPDGVVLFSHDALGEALVTVGMTSFNYERHLAQALDSVSAQTLEHLDLVVVDDGSSDNSVALLLDWAERNRTRFNRLRILRTETNAGLGGARNLVFAEAETPWVMVLDSDNHLAPACCERLLAAVEHDGLAAFGYPRIRQFGGAELVTGAEDFQPARLAAGNYIDAMALVAKWAWAAAGGYYVRRDAMGWEDFSLWCRLVELGLHGVPVAEELAFYRVHARSMVNAITEQSGNKQAMVGFVEQRHPWLRLRMRAARQRLDAPTPR